MSREHNTNEIFFDYDNCKYVIYKDDETPDYYRLGFSCNCYQQIMDNGGKEMLDELYKDCLLPADKNLPECDVTLKIDVSGLGKTQSK